MRCHWILAAWCFAIAADLKAQDHALKFDGIDDRVDVSNFNHSLTEFTVEAWVRKTIPTDFYFDTIVSTNAFRFQIERDNRIAFRAQGGSEWFGPTIRVDGTWQHVAVVWRRGVATLILNAVEESPSRQGASSVAIGELRIGFDELSGFGGPDGFLGELDEIRFWDHARTRKQLKRFMYAKFPEGANGLIGAWSLDAGQGQTIMDDSGSQAHGVLGSSPNSEDTDPEWGASNRSIAISSVSCGYVPLETTFSISDGITLTDISWDFGDGSQASGVSQSHTYSSAGLYNVSVTGVLEGASIQLHAGSIRVLDAPPVAHISSDVSSGDLPLRVRFSNESSGEADSFLWDFGDGSISLGENPVHTFRSPGEFTVTLEALGPCEGDRSVTTMPITIGTFIRGDAEFNNRLALPDAVRILSYLFLVDDPNYLDCLDAADFDDDNNVTISDAIGLLGYLFLGTDAPPMPWPDAGADSTRDGLDCQRVSTSTDA